MHSSFARHLDALAAWRALLDRQLGALEQTLRDAGLLDAEGGDVIDGLCRQVASDRVVVAFVAEFSRGKSELINAIFFADTGRRILPATPGRTTMCPVEIGYQAGEAPMLALLPIHTRTLPQSLDELRRRPELWTRLPLPIDASERLADTLTEVMRTKAVTVDEARALGLWDDERPDVLDTPGLNAIGAEVSLTLGLLPAAQAVVFVVAADAGVTRSDLAIWRDHLEPQAGARYVVLNKVDALADPLLSSADVAALVARQREVTAAALGVTPERVFALSARQALMARIDGQRAPLLASGLPGFEEVLANELLPERHDTLARVLLDALAPLEERLTRRLVDHRRHTAEQLLELRGLRGKSQAKVQLMLQRVAGDARDFERCTVRLAALRAVHSRMLRAALDTLSIDRLRDDLARLQRDIAATLLNLGGRRLFGELVQQLRERLVAAAQRNEEIRAMLQASFAQLNSEFGFALALPDPPSLERALRELGQVERNFGGYLGLANALRLADPRYLEQFRRLLWARLRALFEGAIGELEHWSRDASAQVDAQLRERRDGFERRQAALERIRAAAGELEQRIGEVAATEDALERQLDEVQGAFAALREQVGRTPDPDAAMLPWRGEPLAVAGARTRGVV
ncbi:MAG: dynamin family protein [Burkholderiaceae bacterium]|nr:dynamin family protein [Burkholderiaceae bacterium]